MGLVMCHERPSAPAPSGPLVPSDPSLDSPARRSPRLHVTSCAPTDRREITDPFVARHRVVGSVSSRSPSSRSGVVVGPRRRVRRRAYPRPRAQHRRRRVVSGGPQMPAWVVGSPRAGRDRSPPAGGIAPPSPADGELLVASRPAACAAPTCTSPRATWPAPSRTVPGHQVGRVGRAGAGPRGSPSATGSASPGSRSTCGECRWCRSGAEPLPRVDVHGLGRRRRVRRADRRPRGVRLRALPDDIPAVAPGPLLCAGHHRLPGAAPGEPAARRSAGIWFRLQRPPDRPARPGPGRRLCTSPPAASRTRARPRAHGAAWVGGAADPPPVPLTRRSSSPAGELVPVALRAWTGRHPLARRHPHRRARASPSTSSSGATLRSPRTPAATAEHRLAATCAVTLEHPPPRPPLGSVAAHLTTYPSTPPTGRWPTSPPAACAGRHARPLTGLRPDTCPADPTGRRKPADWSPTHDFRAVDLRLVTNPCPSPPAPTADHRGGPRVSATTALAGATIPASPPSPARPGSRRARLTMAAWVRLSTPIVPSIVDVVLDRLLRQAQAGAICQLVSPRRPARGSAPPCRSGGRSARQGRRAAVAPGPRRSGPGPASTGRPRPGVRRRPGRCRAPASSR